jgi:ubiquinone/menaquinone biosynthesis C-methylase UbiE
LQVPALRTLSAAQHSEGAHKMTAGPAFWDSKARGYAKQPIKDQAAYEKTLERTRAHLPADGYALELGCGTGTTALLLADAVERLHATDISPEMIAIARKKAVAKGATNVTFTAAELSSPEIGGREYDAVLAFNLLHLIEDLPAALIRINDLLAPGALFISKTPCLASLNPLMRGMIAVMQFFGQAPFVAFLTPSILEEKISDAGFDIVETGDYPPKLPSRFIVARKN